MLLVKIQNDGIIYPYSINQLRSDNPQVSFPLNPPESTLNDWGVFNVVLTPIPEYNPLTENLVEVSPELVNGVFTQQWIIAAASQEEIQNRQMQIRNEIIQAVQNRLDDFAATRGYGDDRTSPIVSACSYSSSSHPKYGPEGRYCLQAREDTWDKVFEIEAAVLSGVRPMPISYAEIEAELPALVWPITA